MLRNGKGQPGTKRSAVTGSNAGKSGHFTSLRSRLPFTKYGRYFKQPEASATGFFVFLGHFLKRPVFGDVTM